jgi:methionine salvage enolase-phosphatase E1
MISHILLDIEGTTCPVSFVTETLFPYAKSELKSFLDRHRNDPIINQLIDNAEMNGFRTTVKTAQDSDINQRKDSRQNI